MVFILGGVIVIVVGACAMLNLHINWLTRQNSLEGFFSILACWPGVGMERSAWSVHDEPELPDGAYHRQ